MKHLTLTLIRWRDACQREAIDSPQPAMPELAELWTSGFLIAENTEGVLVGMEMGADDVHPGRYRFTIPKANIVERHDVSAAQAFRKPRARKPRVDKKASPQTEEPV